MRRITIVTREDLGKEEKLIPIKDIFWGNLTSSLKENIVPISDLVLFHCTLMNECKILKTRYETLSDEVISIESPEDENKILSKLMGI